MPNQDFIYSPLGEQITPTSPKRLLRFPTFDSILNFPNVGKPAKAESPTDSQLPNDQKFTCPNCDEITTGFPCQHCGYSNEEDYDPYE